MKLNLKAISVIFSVLGLCGLITLSIVVLLDPKATGMEGGIIVQLLFASMLISGFVGLAIQIKNESK